jgi:hypothetical protein
VTGSVGSFRVDHAVSSGTFSLDGETFDVDNNIWVVGDDSECVVIDAPHSVADILAVVGDRKIKAIVCTHAHDDHVRVAPALREAANGGQGAPIMLHPDDKVLWELTHTDYLWDVDLDDGVTIEVGGTTLQVLHTPGAVCLYAPDLSRLRLHRRHPVQRWSGSDRPVVLGQRSHQGLDPRDALRPTRRYRGAHRSRRQHHHRRGARAPGGERDW